MYRSCSINIAVWLCNSELAIEIGEGNAFGFDDHKYLDLLLLLNAKGLLGVWLLKHYNVTEVINFIS